MNHSEALDLLSSDSAHARLKAARFLARNSRELDLAVLRRALREESVSYVQTALRLAIQRVAQPLCAVREDRLDEVEVPADSLLQLRSKVVQEVTGQLLHEIGPGIGLVASAAARELRNYESSTTKRRIDGLKGVLAALEQLKVAAAAPSPEEFDLAELIVDLIQELLDELTKGSGVEVWLVGERPALIRSDPALVRLAVSNGIRNAIESTGEACGQEAAPVIVSWGETDVDHWVRIADRGPGVVGPVEAVFGMGKSTKKGHTGFGLAIARQAIETLAGTCTLQPGRGGGALYELRWER